MAKKTLITLDCEVLGVSREFEISHAERLLNMPKNGGWVLSKKSEYEFKNGIIIKRNKKGNKGAEKKGRNQ